MTAMTTAPSKKWTLRDVKPGATILGMAGYGSATVYVAYEVISRDATDVTLKVVWSQSPMLPVGQIEYVASNDVSAAIKDALYRFDGIDAFDPATGLLKPREATAAEIAEQQAKDEKWEQFTKSETYMCM